MAGCSTLHVTMCLVLRFGDDDDDNTANRMAMLSLSVPHPVNQIEERSNDDDDDDDVVLLAVAVARTPKRRDRICFRAVSMALRGSVPNKCEDDGFPKCSFR